MTFERNSCIGVGFLGCDYGDTVKALMANKNCSDYYKEQIIQVIPKDADYTYYKAAIAILESDLSDYYILKMIRRISK